jgi:hypothetical protein
MCNSRRYSYWSGSQLGVLLNFQKPISVARPDEASKIIGAKAAVSMSERCFYVLEDYY